MTNSNIVDLIDTVRNKIFNLSVRILNDFAEAEDATQDILIKIYQNYTTLKDKEKFAAWATKVATNHLINLKNEKNKFSHLSFDIMAQDCNIEMPAIDNNTLSSEEKEVLLAELKISCTHAMLMCLSTEERVIYVLSAMFNINSIQGADILDITPETFRQKLSRIKNKLKNFLQNNCGLIKPNATCKCRKRLTYALENNRITKGTPVYLSPQYLNTEFNVHSFIAEMEKMDDFSDVFRTNPEYKLPGNIKDLVITTIK